MAREEVVEADQLRGQDRRSSVRVRSRLPCAVEPITEAEIDQREAQILDTAVIESEGVLHDAVDWRDHADDLSREMVFVLNEVRALRQQLTEIQRLMERQNQTALDYSWIELNDQGLWIPDERANSVWSVGDYAWIRVKIPSIQTPEVLAVGRVIRLDVQDGQEGVAFQFVTISEPHKGAIARYALRRERQMARSDRLGISFK